MNIILSTDPKVYQHTIHIQQKLHTMAHHYSWCVVNVLLRSGSGYLRYSSVLALHSGGVAGPAGQALAGPLFSGSLVPFSDCRDILTIGPGAPRKLAFALCVRIVPAFFPVDQAEPCAAQPDCIGTHVFRSYK